MTQNNSPKKYVVLPPLKGFGVVYTEHGIWMFK